MTIGNYGVAGFVCAFRRAHPEIELEILVENTRSIAARVLQGDLSIGLIEGAIDAEGLEEIPYDEDTLTLVVPPNHRLAKMRRAVRAMDLGAEDFVMREGGSGTRSLFENAMLAAGIAVRERSKNLLVTSGNISDSIARRFFYEWYCWATRSRIPEMIEVARTLRRHFANILTYLKLCITNAAAEGINRKI